MLFVSLLDPALMLSKAGLGMLVLGIPGGPLVQASVRCCLCLVLSNLSKACQGRVPSSPVGVAPGAQWSGQSQVLLFECPWCSPFPHRTALSGSTYMGPGKSDSIFFLLGMVFTICKMGEGHFLSFPELCKLN